MSKIQTCKFANDFKVRPGLTGKNFQVKSDIIFLTKFQTSFKNENLTNAFLKNWKLISDIAFRFC